MTRFWKTASKEEKLAQIDGGIDLEMTSVQVAMNCGTSSASVRLFAMKNGRKFGHGSEAARKRALGALKRKPVKRRATLKARGIYESYMMDSDND